MPRLRLLIGDDHVGQDGFEEEVRWQTSGYTPRIEYFSTPEALVSAAKGCHGYRSTIVVTDLDYGMPKNGYWVLKQLEDADLDCYVWTGCARLDVISETVKELGATLLSKDELGKIPEYHAEWLRLLEQPE